MIRQPNPLLLNDSLYHMYDTVLDDYSYGRKFSKLSHILDHGAKDSFSTSDVKSSILTPWIVNSGLRWFSAQIERRHITVYTEYKVYDWSGILATVGGSLGLIVGFSFLQFMLYLINCVVPKDEKEGISAKTAKMISEMGKIIDLKMKGPLDFGEDASVSFRS